MTQNPLPPGGFFKINKPPGPTSRALVNQMMRLLNCKRVGHSGTLDPFADGLLLVFWGRATRIIHHLSDYPKTYRFTAQFGLATDTQDITGTELVRKPLDSLTPEAIQSGLPAFTGEILQSPPMYSAVRHQGRRLYRLARSGKTVPREPRRRRVDELKLIEWKSPLGVFEITCQTGTYVRTLAHDLGHALGVGACLTRLTRTKIGPHTLDGALGGESALAPGVQEHSLPARLALPDWPSVAVSDMTELTNLRNGLWTDPRGVAQDHDRCRLTDHEGRLVALAAGGREPRLLNVLTGPEESV